MFSMLSLPSPTPPEVIVNMPEPGGTSWVHVLLPGLFVLLGAGIAYFSTWHADSRKASRDRDERIMIDTRTVGLEYLDAANSLSNLIKAQQNPTRALGPIRYMEAIQSAFIEVRLKWGKFELFAHDDALSTGKTLDGAAVLLLMAALSGEHPAAELRDFEDAKYAFINTIRKASGVGEINNEIPDAETLERLKADQEHLLSHVDANLAKNPGLKSTKEGERPV